MSRFNLMVPPLVAFAVFCTSARADEAAIRQFIESYVAAFNKHDVTEVGTMWVETAMHTDRETGERTEGRAAIQADLAAVFQDQPATQLGGRIDTVRMITADVASVDGQTSVGTPEEEPSLSTFSAILVRRDDKWLIDSMEEMPLPSPAVGAEALRELEWLVGRWVDESEGARVDTTFRWTANRAFLLRSFVAQQAGGDTQQGTQIIGWDPRSKQIRSWSFHSDGSFGDGIWSKNGADWLIKSSQTMSDGQAASGTYVLTQNDDNTMTLQLMGLEVEGEPQPTEKSVTVVRVAEDKARPDNARPDNAPDTKPANKR